jgi:atypical dual specificity phosphatase
VIVNFSWVIARKLAGFGVIDGIDAEDYKNLQRQGLGAIVSLTEEKISDGAGCGLRYLHLPITDMQPPTLGDVERFIQFVRQMEIENHAIGVHCQAGLGRTGTILACYLINAGYGPTKAIEEIRRVRPGSIETQGQLQIVLDYAKSLRGKSNGAAEHKE